ncbi:hypothetical protein D9M73_184910 [compost metagenome]
MSWAETSFIRLRRGSYIVRNRPSTLRFGLSSSAMRLMLSTRSLKPSSAKYSHCMGIMTPSAATSAFKVSIESDGGQSIKM